MPVFVSVSDFGLVEVLIFGLDIAVAPRSKVLGLIFGFVLILGLALDLNLGFNLAFFCSFFFDLIFGLVLGLVCFLKTGFDFFFSRSFPLNLEGLDFNFVLNLEGLFSLEIICCFCICTLPCLSDIGTSFSFILNLSLLFFLNSDFLSLGLPLDLGFVFILGLGFILGLFLISCFFALFCISAFNFDFACSKEGGFPSFFSISFLWIFLAFFRPVFCSITSFFLPSIIFVLASKFFPFDLNFIVLPPKGLLPFFCRSIIVFFLLEGIFIRSMVVFPLDLVNLMS